MTVKRRVWSTAIAVLLLFSCAMGCRLAPWRWGGDVQKGIASWYGPGFHGRQTASGEIFDQSAMTAAHKQLPFGTRVRVKNLRNGRSIVVRINDRGPFIRGRIIDLSKEGARRLDMVTDGIVPVRIEVVKRGPHR